METRAPIQSDSDTLRDGIENESFDRTTNNAENDISSETTNPDSGEQNPVHHQSEHLSEREHISERDSEDERELNSQASDSTSTYSNDPKTTIEVTTINIPVESIDGNQSQSENASSV